MKRVLAVLIILLALPVVLTVLYGFLPVPATPLMVIRLFEGYGWHKDWVPMEEISPAMARAVVAAEDSTFCGHGGFDWKAINKAYTLWQKRMDGQKLRGPLKGGSTISQQTAKNLFLWPGRSVTRKALEFPLTWMIEKGWSKRRILEVYLNIVEFGPGVYGVEAAARHTFGTSAKNLSPRQAALLASVLPNPLHWSAGKPGPYIRQRAGIIQARAARLGPAATCFKR